MATTSGLPLLWRLWSRPEADYPGQGFGYTAQLSRDVVEKRSGAASARIHDAISTGTGMPAFYLTPVFITHPGQRYTATVFAKGKGLTGKAQLTLSWHGTTAGYRGKTSSPSLPRGDSGWTQLSVTSTMPLDASYVEDPPGGGDQPGRHGVVRRRDLRRGELSDGRSSGIHTTAGRWR
ncbi:uncharacterized protein SOCE26_057710 [Sorangium cellulosum]|uniref:Uncharacterized protein n=1 Tax=Sorangium cellulosum TaxID=56 RepID=A0A2L0EYC7_SORCE|nr:hypothetical protein [Sorangium cellulosum]AUX44307.1 uncharacterized protein SOCE26_057710 [Sorangium cellulosum]